MCGAYGDRGLMALRGYPRSSRRFHTFGRLASAMAEKPKIPGNLPKV